MYYLIAIKFLSVIVPTLLSVAYVMVAEKIISLQKKFVFKYVVFSVLFEVFVGFLKIIRVSCKKFIVFNLLDEYINIYLNHFRAHFLKYFLNHSFYQSLDISLDLLIIKIYNDIQRINPLIFLILGYNIYMFLRDIDPIFIYLSFFIFLIGIFIQLIVILKNWIENTAIKAEFHLVHFLVKYFLIFLLIVNAYILIIVGEKLWFLIINYIKKFFFKSHIFTKLKDMKLSLEYKLRKSPKNPKNPNSKDLLLINKKKDEKSKKLELKKRAEDLKNKVLNNQRNSVFNECRYNSEDVKTNIKELSFSKNRNWDGRLAIDKTPEFSKTDQINFINEELYEYEKKIEKFKKIVINIDKGKENFYPNESRSLLNNYIDVIENRLLPDLKSQKTSLNKKRFKY